MFHFIASNTKIAKRIAAFLMTRYGQTPKENAQVIVPIGGDGFMLHTLRSHYGVSIPFYGICSGNLGFLMNRVQNLKEYDLEKALLESDIVTPHPLLVKTIDTAFKTTKHYAINEVVVMRASTQAIHLQIAVDGHVYFSKLVGDGVLVSTPAGSSAYNYSAKGSIIPIGIPLLSMMPLHAHQPNFWRGAQLPSDVSIDIEVLAWNKRPASVCVDNVGIRYIYHINVKQDPFFYRLYFHKNFSLKKRIIDYQFLQTAT